MPIRTNFENELKNLNLELIKMGMLVKTSIEDTIKVLRKKDALLAKSIILNDSAIDEEEKSIQSKCLSLILKQQPVATDLRAVSAAIKMVTDLERIGDHASDISEIILSSKSLDALPPSLMDLAYAAKNMVDDAIASVADNDVEKAREIEIHDDIVDSLFIKTKNEIIEMLKVNSIADDECINCLLIAKYFERIGDHSKNICEWVEFNVTGEYKKKRIF